MVPMQDIVTMAISFLIAFAFLILSVLGNPSPKKRGFCIGMALVYLGMGCGIWYSICQTGGWIC